MKVDNFALSMFQTCPSKYDLRIRQGWSVSGKAAALGFGGAMHEGLAAWYKEGTVEAAIQAIHDSWPQGMPPDDYRNEGKAFKVMAEYIKEYPGETFTIVQGAEGALIEVPFSIDTGMFLVCERCDGKMPSHPKGWCCGEPLEPIEYGGIFDGLIEFGPQVYVLEHKTTSQLGSQYFNQFKPNNQITGYIWGAGLLSGKRVGGALINAIGAYKAGTTRFVRDFTTRTERDIAEWMKHVKYICQAIKNYEKMGVWPMHTSACTLYSGCEFRKVHVLSQEKDRQRQLDQAFVHDPWDYEQRDK